MVEPTEMMKEVKEKEKSELDMLTSDIVNLKEKLRVFRNDFAKLREVVFHEVRPAQGPVPEAAIPQRNRITALIDDMSEINEIQIDIRSVFEDFKRLLG